MTMADHPAVSLHFSVFYQLRLQMPTQPRSSEPKLATCHIYKKDSFICTYAPLEFGTSSTCLAFFVKPRKSQREQIYYKTSHCRNWLVQFFSNRVFQWFPHINVACWPLRTICPPRHRHNDAHGALSFTCVSAYRRSWVMDKYGGRCYVCASCYAANLQWLRVTWSNFHVSHYSVYCPSFCPLTHYSRLHPLLPHSLYRYPVDNPIASQEVIPCF